MTTTRGKTVILGHCEFSWAERVRTGKRSVRITPAHCPRCVGELRRVAAAQGYHLIEVDDPDEPTIAGLARIITHAG